MKKLFLVLTFCTQFLLAQEAPSKKRPAAASEPEEIEILEESKEAPPSPAKQAREAKKIYKLKVPVSGTSETITEEIDINNTHDVIAYATIAELIDQATQDGQLLILARTPTSSKGKNFIEYYERKNLHKALFGNERGPQNINIIGRYTLKTPNKAPIMGEIYYYVFLPGVDSFEYLGTDFEMFTDKKIIGKRLYQKATTKLSNSTLSSNLFTLAKQFDYHQALVGLVYLWQTAKKSTFTPMQQENYLIIIDQFISALKDKPVSFLLEGYPKPFEKKTKLYSVIRMLENILKLDITDEQKKILQQKIEELKALHV